MLNKILFVQTYGMLQVWKRTPYHVLLKPNSEDGQHHEGASKAETLSGRV